MSGDERLQSIENKLDTCIGKVSSMDTRLEKFVAEGAVRLKSVERQVDEHDHILKGVDRDPGLVDDVRDLQESAATRKSVRWAAVVAFIGLAASQAWSKLGDLFKG